MPAEAGTHRHRAAHVRRLAWVPAFAGMTFEIIARLVLLALHHDAHFVPAGKAGRGHQRSP